jgi:hypothetical protein
MRVRPPIERGRGVSLIVLALGARKDRGMGGALIGASRTEASTRHASLLGREQPSMDPTVLCSNWEGDIDGRGSEVVGTPSPRRRPGTERGDCRGGACRAIKQAAQCISRSTSPAAHWHGDSADWREQWKSGGLERCHPRVWLNSLWTTRPRRTLEAKSTVDLQAWGRPAEHADGSLNDGQNGRLRCTDMNKAHRQGTLLKVSPLSQG